MNSTSLIAWISVLLLAAGVSDFADNTPRVISAEKFHAPLDSDWTWLREEPKGWKVDDGALRLLALPGHLFSKYNDARNVLLRKAPDTSKPWAVEVFVKSQPKVTFEEAQLLLYYDDDNHIGLFKEHLGKDTHVRMIREVEGSPSSLFEKKYEAERVWFRLAVSNGKVTGYYRQTDHEEWQKMGQADLRAKGEVKIGLLAGGGPKDTDRWVEFRDFRILELTE